MILTFVLFLAGVCLNILIFLVYQEAEDKTGTSELYALNMAPTIISFALSFIIENIKSRKQRIATFILGWVVIVTGLFFVVAFNLTGVLFAGLQPDTKISRYENIRSSWSPEYVKHFPKSIPNQAQNVKFFYRPGFLQGGSTMEL